MIKETWVGRENSTKVGATDLSCLGELGLRNDTRPRNCIMHALSTAIDVVDLTPRVE